jgi:phosphopantothenoylcysteine decarboxylase/phosphopantothenate--cysteine ligase
MDPVRFMTNPSSGVMGITVAQALARRGAAVTVVSGPIDLKISRGIKVIRVETALQMAKATWAHSRRARAVVATAAVCDWRFKKIHPHKSKKGKQSEMSVTLVKNPDIVGELGRRRGSKRLPILIGFSLETKNLERFARRKLLQKNLDLIVANSPDSFRSSTIRGLWIERGARSRAFGRTSKAAVAQRLATWLERHMQKD